MATRKFGMMAGIAVAGAFGLAPQAKATTPFPWVDGYEVGTSRDGSEVTPTPPGSWEGASDENAIALGTGDVAGGDWYGAIYQRIAGVGAVPNSPDGSVHVAELDLTFGDDPFGRQGRDTDGIAGSPPASGSFLATTDLYLNPDMPYGGADGIVDYWWTNAVGDITYYGFYLTEAGFQMTVNPDGTTNVNAAGTDMGNYAADQWITLETIPIDIGGKVWFTENVRDNVGNLLATTTVLSYTNSDWSKVSGPRYTWFVFGDPDNTGPGNLYVDNTGWTLNVVPEPSTLGLLGLAGIAALRRRRA